MSTHRRVFADAVLTKVEMSPHASINAGKTRMCAGPDRRSHCDTDVMPDRLGRAPLHYAALEGDVDAVRRLLNDGADPNISDSEGFTPLHFAAQSRSLDAAELLVAAGADPNAANGHGNSPLFVAVFNSRGEGELIQLLRAHGADPLRVNHYGQTPVGLARLIASSPVADHFADLPR